MKNYKAYYKEHLEMDVLLYRYPAPADVMEDVYQTVVLHDSSDGTLEARYMEFVLGATEAPLE